MLFKCSTEDESQKDFPVVLLSRTNTWWERQRSFFFHQFEFYIWDLKYIDLSSLTACRNWKRNKVGQFFYLIIWLQRYLYLSIKWLPFLFSVLFLWPWIQTTNIDNLSLSTRDKLREKFLKTDCIVPLHCTIDQKTFPNLNFQRHLLVKVNESSFLSQVTTACCRRCNWITVAFHCELTELSVCDTTSVQILLTGIIPLKRRQNFWQQIFSC